MVQGRFLQFFKLPGWFFMVENTPKGTRLISILAPRSRQALPVAGRLWPTVDDGDADNVDDGDDGDVDDVDDDDDEEEYKDDDEERKGMVTII